MVYWGVQFYLLGGVKKEGGFTVLARGVHILEIVSMSTPNATQMGLLKDSPIFRGPNGFSPTLSCSYAGAQRAAIILHLSQRDSVCRYTYYLV